MSKKFRLYTRDYFHVPLPRPSPKTRDNKLFLLCFYVGLSLVWIFKMLINLAVRTAKFFTATILACAGWLKNFSSSQLRRTGQDFSRIWRLMRRPKFLHSLLIFAFLAVLGCGLLASMHLIANALEVKDQISALGDSGKSYLQQAETDLQSQDFTGANADFVSAAENFKQGQDKLNSENSAVGNLLLLLPQTQAASQLLKASEDISQSGILALDIYKDSKNFHLSAAGINSDQPFAATAGQMQNYLNQIGLNLSDAGKNFNQINPGDLPSQDRQQFIAVRQQLQTLNQNFGQVKNLTALAESLLLGQKKALVMFENYNELRPTGGFMGTFGSFNLSDGQIQQLNISSIYDLDGQLQQNIVPPLPVLAVNNRWFLRDSNWFASWPQSAKEISDFYQIESGQAAPDLIIAMTPQFIVDCLKTLGPINLPKYDLSLTADNFVEQTQVASTMDYNSPTNNPKQVLADFFPVFLDRLTHASTPQALQVLQNLQDNLNQKQIVIYSANSGIEQQLENYHWAGQILPTDRDYLSVVSANLGGTKTDLSVNQTINLTTTIGSDGSITDQLSITRQNTLPNLPEMQNDSFIRVMVPQGSKLVSDSGFEQKNLTEPSTTNFQVDPDVLNWEKSIVTEETTGTMIGQEAGKTFFGNWLTINGGQSKTVSLTYTLPFKLNSVDHYGLLLQKQIGTQGQEFNWTLNFAGRQLDWKNFNTTSQNGENLTTNTTLNQDYLLGAVLGKK